MRLRCCVARSPSPGRTGPIGDSPIESFVPISLDLPTLTVDTSEGYQPDLAAIAAFAIQLPGRVQSVDPDH